MAPFTRVRVPAHVAYKLWSTLFDRGVLSSAGEPHTYTQSPEERRAAELANLILGGRAADGSFTAPIDVVTEIIAAGYGIDSYHHEEGRFTRGTDGNV
jgi:hypothetical protein